MANRSIRDTLIDDSADSDVARKRSGYRILIMAKLNGLSGTIEDKAERFNLTVDQVRELLNGKTDALSLPELAATARKIGITVRL